MSSAVKRKALDEASAETNKRPAFASAAAPDVPVKIEPSSGESHNSATANVKSETVKKEEDNAAAEEEEYKPDSHLSGLKRDANGHIICPYLDTINRKTLDFDFEKLCSISLSDSNVYACLVCGKFFQGRGKKSFAYAHSLDPELNHHIFMNLVTEEIYCLPDGYQVFDPSLEDIQYNLHPKFKAADLVKLDSSSAFRHALDGTDYLPGLMGLNNINHTDWLNVLVQALNFIPSWRDFFLVGKNWDQRLKPIANNKPAITSASSSSAPHAAASASSSSSATNHKSDLVQKYSDLLAKLWSPRSFKGHVSPHELLQTISSVSNKKYSIGKFADALQVMGFLLHEIHRELGGTRKKPSVVTKTFQGEIEIRTQRFSMEQKKKMEEAAESNGAAAMQVDGETSSSAAAKSADAPPITVEHRPFFYLSLQLPATPLFQDNTDKAIIPQVPLFELLKKFDGTTQEVTIDPVSKEEVRRTYTITKLPPYLILHYQRFSENMWNWEKNPTLVNFPLENLELKPYTSQTTENTSAVNGNLKPEEVRQMSVGELKKKLAGLKVKYEHIVEKDELVQLLLNSSKSASTSAHSTRYNLLSNIVHEGKPSKELSGNYKCQILHKASNTWYATEDLHVYTSETMAQLVQLSEAYIQIYQRV